MLLGIVPFSMFPLRSRLLLSAFNAVPVKHTMQLEHAESRLNQLGRES
jgi:hypothetical protein